MEHRRVRDIRVTAIDPPRADDADRRLLRLHGAHLYRGGVSTQQHAGIEIEGVVHRPRRVMPRNIQRFEVVVVVLDFRAFSNAVTDMTEELLDSLKRTGNRMQSAAGFAATRQGHIDTLGSKPGAQCCLLKKGLLRIQLVLYTTFGRVDQGAGLRSLFGRQLAQRLHDLGQLAFLTEVLDPDLLQGISVLAMLHRLKRLRDQCIQVFHVQPPEVLAEPHPATAAMSTPPDALLKKPLQIRNRGRAQGSSPIGDATNPKVRDYRWA